jgi:chromosome segregation ATPase
MKLEAAEEDLETERQARSRSEAQRSGRDKEVDELTEHLDEANEILRVRVELLKRRDAEIAQLRSDHEEAAVAAEKTLADLKRRHSEQMAKLEEELEAANKVRRRLKRFIYVLSLVSF